MRIGIDARIIYYTKAGIGQYTINLTRALAQLASDAEFILLQHRKDPVPFVSQDSVSRFGVLTPSHHRLEQMMLALELPLRRLDIDLLHSPDFIPPLHVNNFKSVITVHDLAFLVWPHFLTADGARYYGQIDQAVRRADHIIAVSHSTKNDLVRLVGVPAESITVVHEAANPVYQPVDPAQARDYLRGKFPLPDAFILFVSTIEPRKNIGTLLKAYQWLRHHYKVDVGLVLAGAIGWLSDRVFEEVDELDLREHVTFLGRVETEDLLYLYNCARCLAHPALYEGFGLTPLEAMACGTPVVVSNVSSLPEVVGDAALLVDPKSEEDLAVALHRLVTDEQLRLALREKGLARAGTFSWQRAARETLDVYRQVLDPGRF